MTTTTDTGAFEAMLAHHAALADGVARRAAAVVSSVEGGNGHETAVAELLFYVATEVLPHAMAEEQTIYRAAMEKDGLSELVAGMVDEHRRLTSLLEQMARSTAGPEAAVGAGALGALFAAHVAKENELVLPPLRDDPELDLSALLAEMHRLTEAGADEPDAGGAAADGTADTEGALVRLLLAAASGLAAAGEGDQACRLAGEAWATVRVGRPDLAVRITAALHRLVRSLTAEPVTLSERPSAGAAGAADADAGATLDVRALAPAQRHEKIFATYGALAPGTGFVLVNDHDPKPLRYQFEAEHGGDFTWDTIESGPTVWRVRIGRPAGAADGAGVHADAAPGGDPELDVRRFPHGQRHDVIFATFGALGAGAGFVLVNDHDPKPLRYQFEAQYPGGHSWDYLEAGPEVWRVRIGRQAGSGR